MPRGGRRGNPREDRVPLAGIPDIEYTRRKHLEEVVAYLYVLQGGRCAICETPQTVEEMKLDHSHETGLVRGLLCNSCNIGLGMFRDDGRSLYRACAYVRTRGIVDPLRGSGA